MKIEILLDRQKVNLELKEFHPRLYRALNDSDRIRLGEGYQVKLSEWISANGGRDAVARQLGVTEEAIHYWLRKRITPRVETMQRIVELSKGKVSFEEIIEETKPQAKARGRR